MMSYSNQREHELLDRHLIRDLLRQLVAAEVKPAPSELPRAEHLTQLKRIAGSGLEERWLDWLEMYELRLPSRGQTLVEECHTRPDFMYDEQQTAVYVDGQPHDFPERKDRDRQQTENMEDYGYTVVRFTHDDDWMGIVERYPHVFGSPRVVEAPSETPTAEMEAFEADLFPQVWQAILTNLATNPNTHIEPGSDVTVGGRVIGSYVAEIILDGNTVLVVDATVDGASSVADSLKSGGKKVASVDPNAEDAEIQINSALEAT
jgi:hypothetical protein